MRPPQPHEIDHYRLREVSTGYMWARRYTTIEQAQAVKDGGAHPEGMEVVALDAVGKEVPEADRAL